MPASNNAGRQPVGTDGAYRYSVTVLSVYWPEVELRKLIERWPHLASEVGTTWDEHRIKIERHCAIVDQAGHRVLQASGSVAGFEAFLADRQVTEPSRSDLQTYPDMRSRPITRPWPPARTSPCWCGSGRKYKQCCRPHGLGGMDWEQLETRVVG